MAEEKDIALLADNDIIVEIEVQETPTVIVESPSTTTAEISGDSAIGIVVGALPTIAKEATLIAKVAELKAALNSIDFTAIEQAIKSVEDSTAKETTLTQGVADIIKAVENIDFTDLENSIAEVKNAVANIDFSALAKEQTLLDKAEEIKQAVEKGGGSGLLEEFWDVVPEDSEEIISEEDIHAAVEDIWTQTFNS